MLRVLVGLLLVLASRVDGVIVAEMSLEQKAGQLFLGFVYGDTLDDETLQFLGRSKLGNVIYYCWANGLHSPEQVRTLSGQIQKAIIANTGVAPLIAVDQEGGRVSRLTHGFTPIPSAASLGVLDDPALVYSLGHTLATELASVGINMNLAPVVDVNSNPDNPVIGSRSFGADPEVVSLIAGQVIAAHRDIGVATVLKHFPGHGDTSVNSHHGLPVVGKTLAELQAIELVPFQNLAPVADAIMTGHLLVPALDDKFPATFSSAILQGLLREQWGYRGVIISDSLDMRGIVPNQGFLEEATQGLTEAAIRAFQAGCDCMILGSLEWADFTPTPQQDIAVLEQVMAGFCDAVRNKQISEERLNASVERILNLKRQVKNFLP